MTPAPIPTVPAYASACSGSVRYSSACSCLGYTAPTSAPTSTCLSPAQATSIVETFASFLTAPQASSFSSQANALLADNFTDTSGSIDFLAQQNVWKMRVSTPIPTLTTLDIFYTCNKIAWRWLAQGIGSGQYEVKGIDTFTITHWKSSMPFMHVRISFQGSEYRCSPPHGLPCWYSFQC